MEVVCVPYYRLSDRPFRNHLTSLFDTFYISSQIPICCSIFIFKLYHKTCEQFYRNFGLYEKSPNSFLSGLPRSIINQFRFHDFLCLCLASVHLPHPSHLVFGFQLLGHAVLLCQLRHDQLHAVSCRFVNLSAILSYVHPAIDLSFLFFISLCRRGPLRRREPGAHRRSRHICRGDRTTCRWACAHRD